MCRLWKGIYYFSYIIINQRLCFNIGMKTRHLTSAIIALALTFCGGAFANEIYKYTDADGNVHYTDRPSGDSNEVRLQVSYNRTNNASVQNRVQTRRDATNARLETRAAAEADARTAEETRTTAAENLAKCQGYRAKLKTMLESRRVYRETADGERDYLDDAARAEARSKAEVLVTETCGN